MKKRGEAIFETDIFKACIFMDPRYNVILSNKDRLVAKDHLLSTWKKISSLIDEREVIFFIIILFFVQYNLNSNHFTFFLTFQESAEENDEPVGGNNNDSSAASDLFEALLKKKEATTARQQVRSKESRRMDVLLDAFLNEPRLDKTESVLLYWRCQKKKMPELYLLSQVVLSAPFTQVSVERAFSQLKFILNPQRSRLDPKVLDDILLVRCNNLFKM